MSGVENVLRITDCFLVILDVYDSIGCCVKAMASRRTLSLYSGESTHATPSIRYSSAENPTYSGQRLHESVPVTDSLPTSFGCLTDREGHKLKNLDSKPKWDPRKMVSVQKQRVLDEIDREVDRKDLVRLKEDSYMTHPKPRANYFRPLGMRNSFVSNQLQQRSSPSPFTHRENSEFVAMGTYWLPASGQASRLSLNGRPSSRCSNQSLPPSTSTQQNGTVNGQKKCNGGSKSFLNSGPRFRGAKDPEPRYADPVANAPPGFNQRVAEIAALEAETLRWEKARKVKRKSKSEL